MTTLASKPILAEKYNDMLFNSAKIRPTSLPTTNTATSKCRKNDQLCFHSQSNSTEFESYAIYTARSITTIRIRAKKMSAKNFMQNWRFVFNSATKSSTQQKPRLPPPDCTTELRHDIEIIDSMAEGMAHSFWWITVDGQLQRATQNIYSLDYRNGIIDIGYTLNSTSVFGNDTVCEEYSVTEGETFSKTSRDHLEAQDVMIAYDTDLLAQDANIHGALQTIFRECGGDTRWVLDNDKCVIRRLEVKCGPVTGGNTRYPATSAHVGFVFGPITCIINIRKAISSYSALVKALPSLESIRNTERTVVKTDWKLGPVSPAFWEQFKLCEEPAPAHPVFIVAIPTENKHKVALIKEYFHRRLPIKSTVHFDVVPSESCVGEQPYDDAGTKGAWNRMRNAMLHITGCPDMTRLWEQRKPSEVFFATIENFIQTTSIARPTDFGVVIVASAKRRTYSGCITTGVTVDPRYVDAARCYGADGDFGGVANHGRVTVGTVLASRYPGLDKANWHEVVAGVSRYELLRRAINSLPLP
ncbi:inosine/xanthosine triphosphatase [Microdochium nivale]|nr:inosine/xanthosine triphosphatase [Microdochium nivale]